MPNSSPEPLNPAKAKKNITILGSTGSIGCNTLDVLSRHSEAFSVYALTAHSQIDTLLAQCVQYKPQFAVLGEPQAAQSLQERLRAEGLPTQVRSGTAALAEVASAPQVDMVMAAIVGAAGLPPCMAAAQAGKRILLANKEALVLGADLFLQAVAAGGATLLPIDSEHSAIFQSLPADRALWPQVVDKIILTASGGPFRTWEIEQLATATPEQACAHPNWVMGRKISVDSATMMNKALEVIEAKYLFGLQAEQIEVLIHPQSIVHSMVQYHDASVVAQLGSPDMRTPIAYGLSWPQRIECGVQKIDFTTAKAMTFEAVDSKRFPGLSLAWQALQGPLGSTAVLNAANEVAVAAFLAGRLRFTDIHRVVASTMDTLTVAPAQDIQDLLDIDMQARQEATRSATRLGL